jgi:hypothetical protein
VNADVRGLDADARIHVDRPARDAVEAALEHAVRDVGP